MPESEAQWLTQRVLQRVSRFISSLSHEELVELASGKAKLQIDRPLPSKKSDPNFDPRELVTRLESSVSREEAVDLLTSRRLRRSDLLTVARVLDAAVAKDDSIARVRERIAEAAVGYRLRSEAIREVGPPGKSGKQQAD